MDIASLVGGLGIGSVLTLFLKEYFDSRKTLSKRAFEEKREAYTNYLDIASRSQTMPEKKLFGPELLPLSVSIYVAAQRLSNCLHKYRAYPRIIRESQ